MRFYLQIAQYSPPYVTIHILSPNLQLRVTADFQALNYCNQWLVGMMHSIQTYCKRSTSRMMGVGTTTSTFIVKNILLLKLHGLVNI